MFFVEKENSPKPPDRVPKQNPKMPCPYCGSTEKHTSNGDHHIHMGQTSFNGWQVWEKIYYSSYICADRECKVEFNVRVNGMDGR